MRAWLLAAAFVAAAAAVFFARPHPTPGPPMRDFEAYDAAGAVWNAGGDPYSQAIWNAEKTMPGVNAARYEALPFVAPPALLPLFGMLAKLPASAANTLWRCMLVSCIAALGLLTLRLANIPVTPASFAAITFAAIGFGPLMSALSLGQLALPAMLFATFATFSPGAGVFAWMQPNIGLALAFQLTRARTAIAFACCAAVFAAMNLAVLGIAGLRHYIEVLHRHSLAERFAAIQITPASVAYAFGASAAMANTTGMLVALAAVGVWFVLMRTADDAAARFCATCSLLPLAMPFFHEHDLLVLFVPAIVYANRCERHVWPLAAFGMLLAGTDWLGLAQRPDGTLQTLLLTGALGCALIALRKDVDARILAVPGAVMALIVIAAVFAHAHPAPVWPDGMSALPQNAGTFDIGSAWNAQQRATGLLEREPIWAALRLLSLIGCGLTAAAIALNSRSPVRSKSPLRVRA